MEMGPVGWAVLNWPKKGVSLVGISSYSKEAAGQSSSDSLAVRLTLPRHHANAAPGTSFKGGDRQVEAHGVRGASKIEASQTLVYLVVRPGSWQAVTATLPNGTFPIRGLSVFRCWLEPSTQCPLMSIGRFGFPYGSGFVFLYRRWG